MQKADAQKLVRETLQGSFKKESFVYLVKNILNYIEEDNKRPYTGNYIFADYRDSIQSLDRIGKYKGPDEKLIDILVVHLQKETLLERARTKQRNFVAKYLKGSRGGVLKDAALVAFVAPNGNDWRFSLVKMEYKFNEKGKVEEEFTPARRYSFLVGKNENSHTAQSRLLPILLNDEVNPALEELEEVFSVERVTKEFFEKYRDLFLRLKESLDEIIKKDAKIRADFKEKNVGTVDFAKKLLGQIVFLYFLQKKGWFGVRRGENWGSGSKHFLRELFEKNHGDYKNFFNDILEPLFYEALRLERSGDYYSRFNCRIPFLNGGLFDPLNDYDWVDTEIILPNEIFSNNIKDTKTGDIGDGIVDVFDRYNFTVKEDEPLEIEVAIDPEMLGKVFENLLEVKDRKSKGTYYTPREIVHYMCQESLANYLATELEGKANEEEMETLIKYGEAVVEHDSRVVNKGRETKDYSFKLPENIRKHAQLIDEKLKTIRICDPAVGSGAFVVGMMNEIVRTRNALTPYIGKDGEHSPYHFKRQAIQNCLYGVDIDPGAVEIAKLRLWLSLVVDEEDRETIQPLPNLDYKIVQGNSLLSVEKNLLNHHLLVKLEELKPRYFNETSVSKKKEYKKQIDDLISQLTNGHKDFDFEVYFSEVFHEKKGFDVVIMNPPYIGQKGNKEIFQKIARTEFGKKFHQRRMDLFYFFIHRAIDLGHAQTQIAFITTNYFITATYADKLRRDLFDRATFRNLINFNELHIFESALGQHTMVSIFERGKSESVSVFTATTKRVGFATPSILNSIMSGQDAETEYRTIKQSELYQGDQRYMTLVGNHESSGDPKMALLAKVARSGKLLGTICDVFQGIVTGADKVSPKHVSRFQVKATPGEGIFVLTADELRALRLSKRELKYVRPWFKNSDIGRYSCAVDNSFHLIYRSSKHEEHDLPGIKAHLARFKIILVNRNVRAGEVMVAQYDDFVRGKGDIDYVMIASAMKAGNYYCISYARDEHLFAGPKIVSPQRSHRNTFCFNDVPWYASADVYYITQRDTSIALKYILALLNSKLYFVWLYFKGKRKGEMLELYQKPLSEIPIKVISSREQMPYITLADKILAITKDGDYLESLAKQAKVREYEKQIDQLVYNLYDLTPEEIMIIEGSQS